MFSDVFKVVCKKCGSKDVRMRAENCPECGTSILGECNGCGAKYDYHDFKKVKVN